MTSALLFSSIGQYFLFFFSTCCLTQRALRRGNRVGYRMGFRASGKVTSYGNSEGYGARDARSTLAVRRNPEYKDTLLVNRRRLESTFTFFVLSGDANFRRFPKMRRFIPSHLRNATKRSRDIAVTVIRHEKHAF